MKHNNTNSSTLAILLSKVCKKYEIHHEKPTLVEKFVKGRNETFWALSDINLRINKGDRVGIIGPNGSGKTTLLKIIAGITTPSGGTVHTSGRIVSLIDLEAGFHPDLTGLQNIYLNGMLLGMQRSELDRKLTSIIKFAPMFTYSSGMALRLGFAIAIHAKPDILLLDEGLSVGDVNFQKKAKAKIQELFSQHKTIVVVSHNLRFIAARCLRVLELRKGFLIRDGGLDLLARYDPTLKQQMNR
jgi:ABC-type polysaccharide/polyol phosphate transport system ATPase subunit